MLSKTNKSKSQKKPIDHQVIGQSVLGEYLNHKNLFLHVTGKIPNAIVESSIDLDRFKKSFLEKFKEECWDSYYNRRRFKINEISTYDDVYYFLHKDVLVYINHNGNEVSLLFAETPYKIVSQIHKLVISCMKLKETDKPFIHVMNASSAGLELTRMEIKKTDLEIESHYNDDFKRIDQLINKRLNRNQDKGIILLHGAPGTGKTTYIKHLIANVKKDVIFMPSNIAASLTNPDFMTLLMNHSNSILVIEDAETIVTSRNHRGSSPVSAILNLSDGILSDCLNIQIICSFNTDLSKVDTALLRKGRLIAKYKFGKLETSKANKLSRKLGFSTTFHEPQVLTDVFNQDELQFAEPRNKVIGFK